MPWIIQDDYEVFNITLTKHRDNNKEKWVVENITQLTDTRSDDIQAILAPNKKYIIYVSITGNKKTLMKMDIDGQNQKIIAKDASLPYFIPNTNKLLFVKMDKIIRDFKVYDFDTDKECSADNEQLTVAVASIPYSSLKAKYMLIDKIVFQTGF